MKKGLLLVVFLVGVEMEVLNDPASQQLPIFKEEHPKPIGVMTTSAGAPIEYLDARVSINRNLVFNEYFMDSLTRFLRERIPDRIVHAKAGGAFGYFEVTHNITNLCRAKMFSHIGKRTPARARFSPVLMEKGDIDLTRDARGFAVKFYTEEGNFDLVGFNTEMYLYKDPLLFTTFMRAQKKNPATVLNDDNMLWDFLTLQPESLHMMLLVFSDRGIPDGYRHMPGFPIHTYQVHNQHGEISFMRFHFIPDLGIKNLRSEEARRLSSLDPDYAIRDLYRAIGQGDFPSWTVSIQVLTLEDVKNAGFDVFDVTKVLPLEDYPLRPLGRLVLNKNPTNHFAEVEQLALSPANLVPGIDGGPDKVFEARRLAYRDAQHHRLGANFNNIPVNCPFQSRFTSPPYNRDGSAPVNSNGFDSPNYFPNSFSGPQPYLAENTPELVEIYQDAPNNFKQMSDFYTNTLTKDERSRTVENILNSLGGVAKYVQERAVKVFYRIHPDLGERIEEGLRSNNTSYDPELHPSASYTLQYEDYEREK